MNKNQKHIDLHNELCKLKETGVGNFFYIKEVKWNKEILLKIPSEIKKAESIFKENGEDVKFKLYNFLKTDNPSIIVERIK